MQPLLLQNIDVTDNGGTGLFLDGSYGVTLNGVRYNGNGASGAAMQGCQDVVFNGATSKRRVGNTKLKRKSGKR